MESIKRIKGAKSQMAHRILMVDDDSLKFDGIKPLFDQCQIQADFACSGDEGIRFLNESRGTYAFVLLDYKMPGLNGAETIKRMKEIDPDITVLMYSGYDSDDIFDACMRAGAAGFISTAMKPERIASMMRAYCEKFEKKKRLVRVSPARDEHQKIISELGLVGRAAVTASLVQDVKKVAQTDATVLIRGENGTGKERIARAIHDLSKRKNGPFIALNCSAIPESLLESELFGHTKGSFTGAFQASLGNFMAADRGTLFLDEIGDMPKLLQVKLLRAIQERLIRPVGSHEERKVDVRLIAATNADLESAIDQGNFRQDLYYRLKVVQILIPPLRERRADVLPLVMHFISKQSKLLQRPISIEERAVTYLENYPWPGNVRELEHEIERLCILTEGSVIRAEDLDSKYRLGTEKPEQISSGEPAHQFSGDYNSFRQKLEDAEREYVIENLSKASSMREAARSIFKMSTSSLQRRLQKLKIKIDDVNLTKKEGIKV